MLKTSFGIQLDIPQAGYEYSWIMTSDPKAVSSQPEIKPETTEQKTKDAWGRPKCDVGQTSSVTLVWRPYSVFKEIDPIQTNVTKA